MFPEGTGGVLMSKADKLFLKIKKTGSTFVLFCLFVLILVGTWGSKGLYVSAEENKVKIGYIDQDNFIHNENGNLSGYGVDYLNEIAEYNGWQYEFVLDTWENCLSMLETGEIDFVCMARYTEERTDKFLFSNLPIGYDYTIVYAPTDSDIYFKDYEKMNHTKVGMMYGSAHSKSFMEIAEKQNIQYEAVYYETEAELREALKEGSIDLVASGNLYGSVDAKAVEIYGAYPFYALTGKQNTKLMASFNAAQEQIKIEKSQLETELAQKYFSGGRISSTPLFTREQAEFIQNSEPIKIKLMQGSKPLSYMEDGQPAGIFVRYLNLLSEKSGLQFQIEMSATAITMEQQTEDMKTDSYLMLRAKRALQNNAYSSELISTGTVFSTELAYIARRDQVLDGSKNDYVFAITEEMGYLVPLLEATSAEYTIKYYEDSVECLEAVAEKKADIAIQDSYVVTYLMQKPKFADELVECLDSKPFFNDMCLISSPDQQMIIEVLNETIHHISAEEWDNIISMEMLMNPYEKTIGDLWYEYWLSILLIVLVVVSAWAIYTLLLRRVTTLQIQKKEYEAMQRRVQRDPVSKAYNRAYFYEKAKEVIRESEEEICIVMMDIVNFKVVNDLYGLANGDKVLSQIARELEKLSQDDVFFVSRFSGDHFYMCMKKADYETIKFPKKFKTYLGNMDLNVNYGVFFVEGQKDVPINIMCDRASLAAHNKSKNHIDYIRYYSDEERMKILREQEIENEMEKAMDEKQFCVYVQPKYDLSKEEIVGGEALVRWKHPEKGMISPAEFIGVFEKNGFIIKLDYFVWEETCKLLAKLNREGYKGYPISINVSRAHFYGKGLLEKLTELIEKYGIDASELELEITETICAEDPEIIYSSVRKLQEAGFKVAMDNFGSGYSSLNMLKEMPLDIIKMDLKFLDGGDNIEKSHYILQTLIGLAHNMQLQVVVEGVETRVQVEFLRGIGSYCAQGYYFSKPVESSVYVEMLKKARKQ